MGQAASIALTDDASAANVFSPNHQVTPGTVVLGNAATSYTTPQGQETVTLKYQHFTDKRPTIHVGLALAMPVEVTDSSTGVTSVKDVARFEGKIIIPSTITKANRERFTALLESLFDSTVVTDGYITNLDPMY